MLQYQYLPLTSLKPCRSYIILSHSEEVISGDLQHNMCKYFCTDVNHLSMAWNMLKYEIISFKYQIICTSFTVSLSAGTAIELDVVINSVSDDAIGLFFSNSANILRTSVTNPLSKAPSLFETSSNLSIMLLLFPSAPHRQVVTF